MVWGQKKESGDENGEDGDGYGSGAGEEHQGGSAVQDDQDGRRQPDGVTQRTSGY